MDRVRFSHNGWEYLAWCRHDHGLVFSITRTVDQTSSQRFCRHILLRWRDWPADLSGDDREIAVRPTAEQSIEFTLAGYHAACIWFDRNGAGWR